MRDAEKRHAAIMRDIAARDAALVREQRAADREQARLLERLNKARDDAETRYKAAMIAWRAG